MDERLAFSPPARHKVLLRATTAHSNEPSDLDLSYLTASVKPRANHLTIHVNMRAKTTKQRPDGCKHWAGPRGTGGRIPLLLCQPNTQYPSPPIQASPCVLGSLFLLYRREGTLESGSVTCTRTHGPAVARVAYTPPVFPTAEGTAPSSPPGERFLTFIQYLRHADI